MYQTTLIGSIQTSKILYNVIALKWMEVFCCDTYIDSQTDKAGCVIVNTVKIFQQVQFYRFLFDGHFSAV